MSLWQDSRPLVLASRSMSRRQMLEAAGIPIEICISDVDERAVEMAAGTPSPPDAAVLLACEKAKAVSRLMPGRIVAGSTIASVFATFQHDAVARTVGAVFGRAVFAGPVLVDTVGAEQLGLAQID